MTFVVYHNYMRQLIFYHDNSISGMVIGHWLGLKRSGQNRKHLLTALYENSFELMNHFFNPLSHFVIF